MCNDKEEEIENERRIESYRWMMKKNENEKEKEKINMEKEDQG